MSHTTSPRYTNPGFTLFIRTFGALAALTLAACLFAGCNTAPVRTFEDYTFDAVTNRVSLPTNWVESVSLTNTDGVITTTNVQFWATNVVVNTTYTVSTNAAGVARMVGTAANVVLPGFGEIVSLVLLGLLSLWAKLKSNKSKAVQTSLVQSIETLLAIIETTPQGAQLTDRLKLELTKSHVAANVVSEVATLVDKYVDNAEAKRAAKIILESLPK